MFVYRVFDLDADEYVELTTPVPDTDPRYKELIALSRQTLREAGRRDREGFLG